MSKRVLQMLAITAEITGTDLSEAAAKIIAHDLARYPERQVLGALDRCRKELKGRLTLADILARLDDGRPGPEEAWSMIPRDEASSVVWTEEMSLAFGAALPLLNEGDQVAARMAFRERYSTLVQQARDDGIPPKWVPSLGTDPHGRETALTEAVAKGRLTADHAHSLLPHQTGQGGTALLAELRKRALPHTRADEPETVQ